jgi:hypothetical protein
VLTELQSRGVNDNLIAYVDGLKGFPGGDRGAVSAHGSAALHRASVADPAELRALEAAQGCGSGSESLNRSMRKVIKTRGAFRTKTPR